MTTSVKSATHFGTTNRLDALRLQLMATEVVHRVGRRIKERRLEMGLNQGQLAARIAGDAVNNQRVSDWERGVNKPSERYMELIAAALERPIAWFYAEDNTEETADLMGALRSTPSQLDRLEAKLDAIIEHLGLSLPDVLPGHEEDDLLGLLEGDDPHVEQQPDNSAPSKRARRAATR